MLINTLPSIESRQITDVMTTFSGHPDTLAEQLAAQKPFSTVQQDAIMSFLQNNTIPDPSMQLAYAISSAHENDENSHIQLFMAEMNTRAEVMLTTRSSGLVGTLAYPSQQDVLLTFADHQTQLLQRHDELFNQELRLDQNRTRPVALHFNGELTANVKLQTFLTPATKVIADNADGLVLSHIAVEFSMTGRANRPNDQPVPLFGDENLFSLCIGRDGRLVKLP